MKKLLVLACTLLALPVWGECERQSDDGFVCWDTGRNEGKEKTALHAPDRIFLEENKYRFWQNVEFYDTAGVNHKSLSKYYDVDCADSSFVTLDINVSGDWFYSDSFTESIRNEKGEKNYFQPGSYYEYWCRGIAKYKNDKAREAEIEYQRILQEEEALNAKIKAAKAEAIKKKTATLKSAAKKK